MRERNVYVDKIFSLCILILLSQNDFHIAEIPVARSFTVRMCFCSLLFEVIIMKCY